MLAEDHGLAFVKNWPRNATRTVIKILESSCTAVIVLNNKIYMYNNAEFSKNILVEHCYIWWFLEFNSRYIDKGQTIKLISAKLKLNFPYDRNGNK